MADILTAKSLLLARLRTDTGRTVYDGYVPEKVPQNGVYIKPYTILWAGLGEAPNELTSDGVESQSTLIWDFQTTAVGPDANSCLQLAAADKALLTNHRAGRGIIRPNPDGYNQQTPILDASITPARFMLPLQWRLITN
ncbi:hypothetical protein [Pseudarthrobacter sp. PS3-L1]|uniref:hypothetical protein n=1 Tax=Pseudarthrobacter sp. PS3-L1 TaxID=3046207 RepID=UPI0024B89E7E|nr:hypothetical protein [Pseudarthrobacter sp. PS3-L1]MDJ0321830.1 hypothetical protein [Pseudarthrobacter sp. PS3-L1]